MTNEPQFAIIGAGAMGEAILAGLIRQKLTKSECIHASEPRPERRIELDEKYGIKSTDENLEAISDSNVVVLAVKPQKLEKLLKDLKEKYRQKQWLSVSLQEHLWRHSPTALIIRRSFVRCPIHPVKSEKGSQYGSLRRM